MTLKKVKVNIINMRCILKSGAVTVLSLMMMALKETEESLARDGQTNTHTHRHGVIYSNFFKVA